jgi:hypothetical protein
MGNIFNEVLVELFIPITFFVLEIIFFNEMYCLNTTTSFEADSVSKMLSDFFCWR